jgi:cold shock protein
MPPTRRSGIGPVRLGYDDGVAEPGIVREWNSMEGWGVIDSQNTPGGCWAHHSHLDMEGFRELHAGQEVELTFEDRGQDGCPFRAIRVVVPGIPVSPAFGTSLPSSDAYGSRVVIRFDE